MNMMQVFKFRPSNEEIMEILRTRINGSSEKYVPEIDLLAFEPWEILELLSGGSNGDECHFLTPLKFKYANSTRQDRTTTAGYWKITGKKYNIMNLGIKRISVFHEGRVPDGKRTSYVVHAYEHNDLKGYVYCRLFNKQGSDANANHQGEPSTYRASSSEYHVAEEEYPQQETNQENPAACYPMDTFATGYIHNGEYSNMDMNCWGQSSFGQGNYAFDDTNSVAEFFNN